MLETDKGTPTQIFNYFIDSANCPVGIVTSDVTTGNLATVQIMGEYTMQNNTLIVGNDYFNNYGAIDTYPIVKKKIGKASDTDKIVINIQ